MHLWHSSYQSNWYRVSHHHVLTKIFVYQGLAVYLTRSHSLSFQISPVNSTGKQIQLTAVVVPKVTCDLPLNPIPYKLDWKHISDLPLADPNFGRPGRIDLLLRIDVYVDILCHGKQIGPIGSPPAFETYFGWVLFRRADSKSLSTQVSVHITTFHTIILAGVDIPRRCSFPTVIFQLESQ